MSKIPFVVDVVNQKEKEARGSFPSLWLPCFVLSTEKKLIPHLSYFSLLFFSCNLLFILLGRKGKAIRSEFSCTRLDSVEDEEDELHVCLLACPFVARICPKSPYLFFLFHSSLLRVWVLNRDSKETMNQQSSGRK